MPLLPTVAVLLSLAAAAPRGAPSPEEERLFNEGVHALDAGDARGAQRAWKQGYAVAHDPAFLVRVGEAEEKAGAPAEAIESYRRYLREAPDASDRADVEQRLARLGAARPDAAATPAAQPSNEPTHEFGDAPAPTLPATPGPGPGDEVRPGLDAEIARRPPADEDTGWTPANITAWSATGATVLLLGTAAFFGALASSKEGDVNRLTSFRDENGAPLSYTPEVARQYESATADGRRYARDGKIFLLASAGTAAVACVFFVIDGVWPAKPAGATGVSLGPTPESRGGAVAWSWRF